MPNSTGPVVSVCAQRPLICPANPSVALVEFADVQLANWNRRRAHRDQFGGLLAYEANGGRC
jgi:hypothetical protein